MNTVLNFIKNRFPTDCNWTTGNCYYFAIILKARFPKAVIWYNVISGHFFVNIDGHDYDWTGEIHRSSTDTYVLWEDMNNYDSNVRKRIIRDCIS